MSTPTPKSDTPRSDSIVRMRGEIRDHALYELARELERENAALRDSNTDTILSLHTVLCACVINMAGGACKTDEKELAKLVSAALAKSTAYLEMHPIPTK